MKVIVLFCVILAAGLGQEAPVTLVVNEEIDRFLSSVNHAVEVTGINYISIGEEIAFMDTVMSEIYFGDLSTWRRLGDFQLVAKGVNDFATSGAISLGAFQFLVNKLQVATNYTGILFLSSTTNSLQLGLNVTDRFGPACSVDVTRFDLEDLNDVRLYTPDGKGAGLLLEKTIIVDHIKKLFKGMDIVPNLREVTKAFMSAYFCRGPFQMEEFAKSFKSEM